MQLIKTAKVFYKDRFSFYLINLSLLIILATWLLFFFKKVAKSPLTVLQYLFWF